MLVHILLSWAVFMVDVYLVCEVALEGHVIVNIKSKSNVANWSYNRLFNISFGCFI